MRLYTDTLTDRHIEKKRYVRKDSFNTINSDIEADNIAYQVSESINQLLKITHSIIYLYNCFRLPSFG